MWPLANLIPLRPAPHVWPPPPDHIPAPDSIEACSIAATLEPCTTTVPPRLFERRLELRVLLGKGCRGETWRAYHHILGRDVAVKIIPRAHPDSEVAAALCREAAALDKLRHRAFPRVLECDYAEDGSWYMVEEYIDGEPLTETFKRAPLEPLTAIELVIEIAEALCEAQDRGILHGDIHGGNLLLERTLPPRPRIIDLSECRLATAFFAATDQRYALAPTHRINRGANRGHPDFCAPELWHGAHPSEATDVHALGVVLFILLTGEQSGNRILKDIFGAGEREEAGERLREHVIATAPELADTFIATELQDILAPEPERRTPTMAKLLELLRAEAEALRDLRSLPESAPTASVAAPASPTVPRPHGWIRWAVTGSIAAVALAAAWMSLRTAPSPSVTLSAPNDPPAPPPPAKDEAIPVNTDTRQPETVLTRTDVQALVATRSAELAGCPDAPTRLMLGIDVGPRAVLTEIQHVALDLAEPLDRCVNSIVGALDFPTTSDRAHHTITLDLPGATRQ